MSMLQSEIKRLRREAQDLKIVKDGETFQVVRFETDDTGVAVGKIVAGDIADAKTARVMAGSVKAIRMLQESRDVIREMLERTENPGYIAQLRDLDNRILEDTLSTFDPDKWRELFGPLDVDIGDLLTELDHRAEGRASAEADISLDGGNTADGADAEKPDRQEN